MIKKIKNLLERFKKYQETTWINCHECAYRVDCETREIRDGCFLGDKEEIVK